MLNFNDGLPAIIQPDHATIKSRDRTHLLEWQTRYSGGALAAKLSGLGLRILSAKDTGDLLAGQQAIVLCQSSCNRLELESKPLIHGH